tara:strand:+ start:169 stop:660 length:492 start_codon:yes stop_codon:yes gene_type:complete
LKLIYLITYLLVFNVFSDTPIDTFNNLIKEDLIFIQKSLNQTSNKHSSSSGNLTHSQNLITINVNQPFKERYEVNDSYIDIYDYDFDQYKKIYLDDIESNLINYLIKGIEENVNIINLSDNSFTIDDGLNGMYIEIVDDKNFFIKFKDNMGTINMVTFKVDSL